MRDIVDMWVDLCYTCIGTVQKERKIGQWFNYAHYRSCEQDTFQSPFKMVSAYTTRISHKTKQDASTSRYEGRRVKIAKS